MTDIEIINNSNNISHLQSIDVIIEKYWTVLRGIDLDEDKLLKSIGKVTIDIDFNKLITTELLNNPLVVEGKKSYKFSIQLNNFKKLAKGNNVIFKFRFNFNDDFCLKRKSFLLYF